MDYIFNRWHLSVFWEVFAATSIWRQAVTACSPVIGILMLRGATTVWKFVLVLLGCHIALQIINFSVEVRGSWYGVLFFAINLVVFLFIADQLVWKVKVRAYKPAPSSVATAAATAPLPPPVSVKKVLIHFEGFGPWARLHSISSKGLRVRSIKNPPVDFAKRELEIGLSNGSKMRAQLTTRQDQDFYFEFKGLTSDETLSLQKWLESLRKAS